MKITIELIIEERHGDPLLTGPDPLKKVTPDAGEKIILGENFFDKFIACPCGRCPVHSE